MAFEQEKRNARRILEGIEDAKLDAFATWDLLSAADPTLVYFLFAWIRAHYPSSHSASDGVLGRLGALLTQYPEAARMAKKGQGDSIVSWFEDAYSYRDLPAGAFIELIVDKLEG